MQTFLQYRQVKRTHVDETDETDETDVPVVDRLVKSLPAQLIEVFRERDKHSKPAYLDAFGQELFRHPDFSWSGRADCQPRIAYQPP